VGLGTLGMQSSPRLVVLWTTLLGLWLVYREGRSVRFQYQFVDVGRGAVIGLAVGAILMLLAFGSLVRAIPILYVSVEDPSLIGIGGTTIFLSLVLLAPLAEELFFRDVLHRERGLVIGAVLYAAAGIVFFLPTAGRFPAVLAAVSGASALLGVMYSFLYERYGLATAMACHTITNLFLLYMPAILSHLDLFSG
jgi:membrane protease YdiL (CAAX protease family)